MDFATLNAVNPQVITFKAVTIPGRPFEKHSMPKGTTVRQFLEIYDKDIYKAPDAWSMKIDGVPAGLDQPIEDGVMLVFSKQVKGN